jgi:hypothetical protein
MYLMLKSAPLSASPSVTAASCSSPGFVDQHPLKTSSILSVKQTSIKPPTKLYLSPRPILRHCSPFDLSKLFARLGINRASSDSVTDIQALALNGSKGELSRLYHKLLMKRRLSLHHIRHLRLSYNPSPAPRPRCHCSPCLLLLRSLHEIHYTSFTISISFNSSYKLFFCRLYSGKLSSCNLCSLVTLLLHLSVSYQSLRAVATIRTRTPLLHILTGTIVPGSSTTWVRALAI